MDCPICKVALIVVEREGIELDYCIICNGFWFDAGELSLLSEVISVTLSLPKIDELATVETKEKSRNCPLCKKIMDKINLGDQIQVLVDRCPNGDGLWFDSGELGRVINQHMEGTLPGGKATINFLGEFFRAKK